MINRFVAVIVAAATAWALNAGAALAAGEDVFVVPRVAVQAQADSASAAKRQAQREGRRKAIDLLLRRLTVEDDWPLLPKTGPAPAPVENETVAPEPDVMDSLVFEPGPQLLTDERLEQLESGFEVYSEKSSSRTYRAFITYRFKPEAVRMLLKDAKIAYSEAQTRPALVVPVLQTANGVYLWEQNNPWLAAWKVRPFNNELTPMIAPLGDLEDSVTINAQSALAVNETALAELAQRYSVSQVIVAHAFLQQRNGQDRLRVRFINGYRETADIAPAIELEEGEFDSIDGGDFSFNSTAPTRNPISQAAVGDVMSEAWFSQASGSFPALAERAIEGAIAKYAKPWKEQTLIDHSIAAFLNVSAYYNSLSDWSLIRSALVSTPLVGSVQVSALSRGGAEMLIQAFGDPEKLIVAMDAQGLVFWSGDGVYWNIATPSVAQIKQSVDRRGAQNRYGADGASAYADAWGEN